MPRGVGQARGQHHRRDQVKQQQQLKYQRRLDSQLQQKQFEGDRKHVRYNERKNTTARPGEEEEKVEQDVVFWQAVLDGADGRVLRRLYRKCHPIIDLPLAIQHFGDCATGADIEILSSYSFRDESLYKMFKTAKQCQSRLDFWWSCAPVEFENMSFMMLRNAIWSNHHFLIKFLMRRGCRMTYLPRSLPKRVSDRESRRLFRSHAGSPSLSKCDLHVEPRRSLFSLEQAGCK